MEPNIQLNMTAVIVAVIANFLLGWLWYGPLFSKPWARAMGMDITQKPPSSVMIRGMIFMLIGTFLMVYVFAHNAAVWNPVTWGQPASPMSPMSMAFAGAFFTWLGFFLPQDLSRVAWENKSWTLFFINAGWHFVGLLVVSLILHMM